jgi:hypothetical protein
VSLRADAAPLRALLPLLEAAQAQGAMGSAFVTGSHGERGTYPAYSPVMDDLWAAFRAAGVDPHARLDYIAWQGDLGFDPDDPDHIAAMSLSDLHHLLVRFARVERFCDGYWVSLLNGGSFLAAARRMIVLAEG